MRWARDARSAHDPMQVNIQKGGFCAIGARRKAIARALTTDLYRFCTVFGKMDITSCTELCLGSTIYRWKAISKGYNFHVLTFLKFLTDLHEIRLERRRIKT